MAVAVPQLYLVHQVSGLHHIGVAVRPEPSDFPTHRFANFVLNEPELIFLKIIAHFLQPGGTDFSLIHKSLMY